METELKHIEVQDINLIVRFAKWIDDNYYQHDTKKNTFAKSREDFLHKYLTFNIESLAYVYSAENYGKL